MIFFLSFLEMMLYSNISTLQEENKLEKFVGS